MISDSQHVEVLVSPRESRESRWGPPRLVSGWYALGLSRQLKRGMIWKRRLHGRELVVARFESGRIAAFDPFCPHLGAHLGHSGHVEGDTIRCAFHGFRFDCDGRCVGTAYDRPPPRGPALTSWPIDEIGGVVVAWAGASGDSPAWSVPSLDMSGWSPWKMSRHQVAGHPQETTENSVDLGHFSTVHGYSDVYQTKPLQMEGPHLTIAYHMTRPLRLRSFRLSAVSTFYDIDVWGLGWSRVEVQVERPPMRVRFLVLATQVDRGAVDLRLAVSMPLKRGVGGDSTSASRLPPALWAVLVVPPVSYAYNRDVSQDFSIWRHKHYVPNPALAAGDGPIMPYRRWARQFYGRDGAEGGE